MREFEAHLGGIHIWSLALSLPCRSGFLETFVVFWLQACDEVLCVAVEVCNSLDIVVVLT